MSYTQNKAFQDYLSQGDFSLSFSPENRDDWVYKTFGTSMVSDSAADFPVSV